MNSAHCMSVGGIDTFTFAFTPLALGTSLHSAPLAAPFALSLLLLDKHSLLM